MLPSDLSRNMRELKTYGGENQCIFNRSTDVNDAGNDNFSNDLKNILEKSSSLSIRAIEASVERGSCFLIAIKKCIQTMMINDNDCVYRKKMILFQMTSLLTERKKTARTNK